MEKRVAGLAFVVFSACAPVGPRADEDFDVMVNGNPASNIDVGIDAVPAIDSDAQWVFFDQPNLLVEYPANQDWGSVTFLLGTDLKPENRDRRSTFVEDFAAFDRLELRARGNWRVAELFVKQMRYEGGMDLGGRPCALPAVDGWHTFEIPIDTLNATGDDNRRLWAPAVLVFDGPRAINLEVERMRLLRDQGDLSEQDIRCPRDCVCLTDECRLRCEAK